jgi:hypothetical protein
MLLLCAYLNISEVYRIRSLSIGYVVYVIESLNMFLIYIMYIIIIYIDIIHTYVSVYSYQGHHTYVAMPKKIGPYLLKTSFDSDLTNYY